MRLVVTTPTSVVADIDDLAQVQAEDETGAFGILPGHADFVTVLPISVVTWRDGAGREGFVLVWGGFLNVRNGNLVEIAARNAFREEELAKLGDTALAQLMHAETTESEARTSDTRLHLAAIRQIEAVLRAGRYGKSPAPVLDGLRRSPELADTGGPE